MSKRYHRRIFRFRYWQYDIHIYIIDIPNMIFILILFHIDIHIAIKNIGSYIDASYIFALDLYFNIIINIYLF